MKEQLRELRLERHQLEQFVRLQQQFRMIRGPAHRNRELNLPVLCSGSDEPLHQLAQLWNDQ